MLSNSPFLQDTFPYVRFHPSVQLLPSTSSGTSLSISLALKRCSRTNLVDAAIAFFLALRVRSSLLRVQSRICNKLCGGDNDMLMDSKLRHLNFSAFGRTSNITQQLHREAEVRTNKGCDHDTIYAPTGNRRSPVGNRVLKSFHGSFPELL